MITEQTALDMEYCQLAADWLEDNGWCAGTMWNGGTPQKPDECCLYGALLLVTGGSAQYSQHNYLPKSLVVRTEERLPNGGYLTLFNDSAYCTTEKAISFLRHAGTEKSGVVRYD